MTYCNNFIWSLYNIWMAVSLHRRYSVDQCNQQCGLHPAAKQWLTISSHNISLSYSPYQLQSRHLPPGDELPSLLDFPCPNQKRLPCISWEKWIHWKYIHCILGFTLCSGDIHTALVHSAFLHLWYLLWAVQGYKVRTSINVLWDANLHNNKYNYNHSSFGSNNTTRPDTYHHSCNSGCSCYASRDSGDTYVLCQRTSGYRSTVAKRL